MVSFPGLAEANAAQHGGGGRVVGGHGGGDAVDLHVREAPFGQPARCLGRHAVAPVFLSDPVAQASGAGGAVNGEADGADQDPALLKREADKTREHLLP